MAKNETTRKIRIDCYVLVTGRFSLPKILGEISPYVNSRGRGTLEQYLTTNCNKIATFWNAVCAGSWSILKNECKHVTNQLDNSKC